LISIHTPARGVTDSLIVILSIGHYFNPHTREGCDNAPYSKGSFAQISIHTPARGVTNNR